MRTVIGTITLVTWVGVYVIAAILLAGFLLPGQSPLVQAVYYVIAGFVWVGPAMVIIWWMTARFRRTNK